MHKKLTSLVFVVAFVFGGFSLSSEELPYRTKLFTNETTPFLDIVPAYLDNDTGYTADDTKETKDTLITDEIKQKVAELNYDPVKIYEFVKNNIDYIPYYGSKLGATGTLYEKRANAFDQSSLLIAMYRSIGIPCRYVFGNVEIKKENAMNWIGVESDKAAIDILFKRGLWDAENFIDDSYVVKNNAARTVGGGYTGNQCLSITSNKIQINTHLAFRDECYVYKDFSEAKLSFFQCTFKIYIRISDYRPSDKPFASLFMISNTAGNLSDCINSLDGFAFVNESIAGGNYLCFRNLYNGERYRVYKYNDNTEYNIEIQRKISENKSIYTIRVDDKYVWSKSFENVNDNEGTPENEEIVYTQPYQYAYPFASNLSPDTNLHRTHFGYVKDFQFNPCDKPLPDNFPLNHVWVEAYLPYSTSRGKPLANREFDNEDNLCVQNGEGMWIPLDPSYKKYDNKFPVKLPKGMPVDALDFLNQYIYSPVEIMPDDLYIKNLENYLADRYPEFSIEDLKFKRSIIPEKYDVLPLELSKDFKSIAITGEDYEIDYFDRWSIELYASVTENGNSILKDNEGNVFKIAKSLSELYNKRITLKFDITESTGNTGTNYFEKLTYEYKQDYGSSPQVFRSYLKPIVTIEGEDQNSIEQTDNIKFVDVENNSIVNKNVFLSLDYIMPKNGALYIYKNPTSVTVGSVCSVFLDYDCVGKDILRSRFDRLKENEEKIDSGEADNCTEKPITEVLYSIGGQFFYNMDSSLKKLAELMNIYTYTVFSHAFLIQQIAYDEGDINNPNDDKWTSGTYTLDVNTNIRNIWSRANNEVDDSNYLLVGGMCGSAHEHKIFEDMFNVKAVSTMRILWLAAHASDENPNEIFYIDSLNYASYIDNAGGTWVGQFDDPDNQVYTNIYNHFYSYYNPIVDKNNDGIVDGTEKDVFIIPKRITTEDEAGVSRGTGYILLDTLNNAVSYIITDSSGEQLNGGRPAINFNSSYIPDGVYTAFQGTSGVFSSSNYNVTFNDYKISHDFSYTNQGSNFYTPEFATSYGMNYDSFLQVPQNQDDIYIYGLSTSLGKSVEKVANDYAIQKITGSFSSISNDEFNSSVTEFLSYNRTSNYKSPSCNSASIVKIKDPVDSRTGEFYSEAIDVKIPGKLPIVVKRNYSSQQETFDCIGYGWTLNVDYFLWGNDDALDIADNDSANDPDPQNVILRLSEEDGSVIEYSFFDNDSGNLIFKPDPIRNPELVNFSDTGIGSSAGYLGNQIVFDNNSKNFVYRSFTGIKKTFYYKTYYKDGELVKKRLYLDKTEDLLGNYLQYEYNENENNNGYGLPKRIINGSGSFIDFEYNSFSNINKIISSDKREIQYLYDELYNLVEVIDPSGKVTKYEYAKSDDGYLTHNISRIIKPDNRILENIYDDEKVIEQRMTIGFNAVPQRTASFEYGETDNEGYRTTTVTSVIRDNRDGTFHETLTEYKFDEKEYVIQEKEKCVLNFNDGNLANSANSDYEDIGFVIQGNEQFINGALYFYYLNSKLVLSNTHKLGNIEKLEFKFKFSTNYGLPESHSIYVNNDNKNNITIQLVDSNTKLKINAKFLSQNFDEIEVNWNIDTWYKISVLLNKSNNKLKLFVDDNLKSEVTYTSQENNLIDPSSDIIFECVDSANSGYLDDVNFSSYTKAHPLYLVSVTEKDNQGNELSSINRTWDNDGNLTSLTDAEGNKIYYNYDNQGRLLSSIIVGDTDNEETYYTYFSDTNLILKNKVKTITDPNNKVIEYNYNTDGTLKSATKYKTATISDGNYVLEEYIYADGLLTQKTVTNYADNDAVAGESITTEYAYDRFGNVIALTNPEGEVTEFAYDEWGNRTRVTNSMKESTLYTYDNSNRVIKITDPENNCSQFKYDDNGNKILEINALGHKQYYLYDYSDSLLGVLDPLDSTVLTKYDIYGNKTEITNQNDYTRYFKYDDLNRLIEEKDMVFAHNSTVANIITTLYEYDCNGNVISKEIKSKQYLTQEEPVTVSKTEYEYNHRNQITTEKQYTESGKYIKVAYEYDKVGNLVKEKNYIYNNGTYVLDTYTSYDYSTEFDGEYRLKKITACKADDTELSSISYDYDYLGNKIKETDAMGHITEYEYDKANRLIKTKVALNDNPQSDSDYAITELIYDQAGRTIELIDANGNSTCYEYDKAGRVVIQKDAENRITRFKYDAVGNKIEETLPSGKTTFYTYDELNRLVSVKDEFGNESQIEYDALGNQIKTIDAKGNTTTYAYDELSRPVQITDPLNYTVNYKYDFNANGNQTKTMIAQLDEDFTAYRKTVWIQDWLARTVSVEDGLNGEKITSYNYDDYGRLVSETTPNGDEILYDYDDLGNLIRKTCDSDKRIDVAYSYDKLGRRTVMSDITGTTEYDYDILGNLKLKRLSNKLGIVYQNDYLGNVTKMTFTGINYPGSWASSTDLKSIPNSIQYTYNKTYQLESILHNNKTVTYEYNDAGLLAKQTNPDNSYIFYNYDALDRLSSLENRTGTSILSSQTFQYDELGNKTYIVTQHGSEKFASSYRYDKKNQLIRELYKNSNDDLVNVKYTYDGTGNRLEYKKIIGAATETYSYTVNNLNQVEAVEFQENNQGSLSSLDVWGVFQGDIGSNTISVDGNLCGISENIFSETLSTFSASVSLTSTAGDSICLVLDIYNDICYTYDDNGNLVYKSQNGQTVIYLWDALNRLTDVYYADNESVVQHIQYMYNGDGQRIYEILSDGSLTGFLYDGNQVIAEFNEDGKVISQHIHGSGLGGDVGSLVYKEELNSANEVDTSYYFYNYRGDVIDVVSDTGTVFYRYDAFGNIIGASYPELGFSSKRFDSGTGLSYFGARYYDSLLGRFISRDPMGYIDGPNQYIYVANNPLGFIDPFGFCKRNNDINNSPQDPPNTPPPGNDVEAIPILANLTVPMVLQMMTPAGPVIAPGGMSIGTAGLPSSLIPFQYRNASQNGGDDDDNDPKGFKNSDDDQNIKDPSILAKQGRQKKNQRLTAMSNDQKESSVDRGWIKQEQNAIQRGQRNSIRVPPGKNLAHKRGMPAKLGFSYEYSDLQGIDLHKLQHRFEGY